MKDKPARPKYFFRSYLIMMSLPFILLWLGNHYEVEYTNVFCILLAVVIPSIMFRKYYEACRAYYKHRNQLLCSAQDTNVNKNIDRYKAKKKAERQNVKWWQFWV